MPGAGETFYPLSEDEKINIRLRAKAGEPLKEIAADYSVPLYRIKGVTLPRETREKHNEIKRLTRRRNFIDKGGHVELRAEMLATYNRRTGRDLLADLQQDAQCPSPPSS